MWNNFFCFDTRLRFQCIPSLKIKLTSNRIWRDTSWRHNFHLAILVDPWVSHPWRGEWGKGPASFLQQICRSLTSYSSRLSSLALIFVDTGLWSFLVHGLSWQWQMIFHYRAKGSLFRFRSIRREFFSAYSAQVTCPKSWVFFRHFLWMNCRGNKVI